MLHFNKVWQKVMFIVKKQIQINFCNLSHELILSFRRLILSNLNPSVTSYLQHGCIQVSNFLFTKFSFRFYTTRKVLFIFSFRFFFFCEGEQNNSFFSSQTLHCHDSVWKINEGFSSSNQLRCFFLFVF